MAQYKCKKCGEEGHSKNIACRSLFCDDQIAAIMTNICNVITTTQENGRRKVAFEFPYGDSGDGIPDDELEFQAAMNIKGLDESTIRKWLCDHEWELTAGEPIPC